MTPAVAPAGRPGAPGPAPRFFGLLALLLVAGCAAYAASVLGTATPAEALALPRTYPYGWAARPYTAAEFTTLRQGLWLVAAAAALAATALAWSAPGRVELQRLRREVAGAGRALPASWRALSTGQRRLAAAALAGLTALRVYYSCRVQPYDDATSYEFFVRESLLTVSGVYNLPNNHLLSNTVAWALHHAYPGFWWSMRLPVLLASTAATAYWFLALLPRSSFRVALRAVGWFGLLHLSVYYAATGRGYWLQIGLGGMGFLALLALAAPAAAGEQVAPRARAAWAGLLLTGVLGLYTVPTHAFFLASAYSWLGLQALRQRALGQLGQLAAVGGATLLGAGLLYAPLLLLSGAQALLHNPYVRPLARGEFWALVASSGREAHHAVGVLGVGAVLLGAGRLWQRARARQLPPELRRPVGQLVPPSAWMVLVPYGLAVLLHVLPPERTFLYKAQYLCIIASLLAEWVRKQLSSPRARQLLAGALRGGTVLFIASQLWQLERQEALWRQGWRWQLGAPAADWLATQPPGPVLAPEGAHCLLLRFYLHSAYPRQLWPIDHDPQPGVHYRYLVQAPATRPGRYPVRYRNALLTIAPLP